MSYPYRTLFWISLALTIFTWAVHVERIQAQAYTDWLIPTMMTLIGIVGIGTTFAVWGHARLAAGD